RSRLRLRVRNNRSLRRKWHGVGRFIRMGRSVWHDLPRRSQNPDGHGDDDSDAAQYERHRRAFQRNGVSVAAGLARKMSTTIIHKTAVELEAGLESIRQSPRDRGVLQMIVRRPAVGVREVL